MELSQSDLENFRDQRIEESVNIDYKRYQAVLNSPDEIARNIVAFANTNGGLLFLGFSEKKVKNHRIADDIDWGDSAITAETLENRLHSRIKPTLDFSIIQVWNDEKTKHIYLIDIPQGKNGPYWCKQGFYRRRDTTSEMMDYDEIKNQIEVNYFRKLGLYNNVIAPLGTELINISYSINVANTIDLERINQIMSNQAYYMVELYDDLFELFIHFKGMCEKFNSYLSYIERKTYKIINEVIQNQYPEYKGEENSEAQLWVDMEALNLFNENYTLRVSLHHCILNKIHPKELYANNDHLLKILGYSYLIRSKPNKYLSAEEFEILWEKILTLAGNNYAINEIWVKKEEIENHCDLLLGVLDSLK